MKSLTSWLGSKSTTMLAPDRLVGRSAGTWSRVTASVNWLTMPTRSPTLANWPTRVIERSCVPDAFSSTVSVVSVKFCPQASMDSTPACWSRSGRRYVCITNSSASEFATGVPVAKVATRST